MYLILSSILNIEAFLRLLIIFFDLHINFCWELALESWVKDTISQFMHVHNPDHTCALIRELSIVKVVQAVHAHPD